MTRSTGNPSADREKHRVAASSVAAAVVLTSLKLIVGIYTGSLGILAEAAHSGLDLAAAGMTLWAVWISSKPADAKHTYGHGKFENLSALFETLLLLMTCAWIVYESIHRLFFMEKVEVDANLWAFLVVIASIIIDYSRSRALMRVAKKHQSQALEADALHFSTDIWSSAVVLMGLLGVLMAGWLALPWLVNADSLAALAVAVIVIGVCYRLGKKAIDDLLDSVPPDLQQSVQAAALAVSGVERVAQVRLRRSGPEMFADITFAVNRVQSFEKTHEIADQVEEAVRKVLPNADVTAHVEPLASEAEDLLATVRRVAGRHGLGAHGIRVHERGDHRSLELHLEMNESLSLEQAHKQATEFEKELRQTMPGIQQITSHLEPVGSSTATVRTETAGHSEVSKAIHDFLKDQKLDLHPHKLQVESTAGDLAVSFHCKLDRKIAITTAHDITDQLEKYLRTRVPSVKRVLIHVEPSN